MIFIRQKIEEDHIYTKEKHYSFSMVLTAVIVCISLITVSAFHSDMSEWLTNHFSKEDIHPVENVDFKDISWGEAPFGYTYTKDDKIKISTLCIIIKSNNKNHVHIRGFIRSRSLLNMFNIIMIFSCMIFQVM